MSKSPPSETRERIYRYMRERLMAGQPPTVREVRDALGFRAVQTIYAHLQGLVEEGRLLQAEGKARGWRLPGGWGEGTRATLVPLLGQVQAGELTTALEEPEGYIPVVGPQGSEREAGLFALRVQGQSMRDVGILSGDVVIVRRQQQVDNGDVVVALVGDEATVKTWRRRPQGGIELVPANPDFEVIVPDPRELLLLGKVIEVRRHLEANAPIGVEVR